MNCYALFPQIGAHVPYVDCRCGFRNVIYSAEPMPMTRLDSAACMQCGRTLDCPKCGHELREGNETEVDAILVCPDCGFWFCIW